MARSGVPRQDPSTTDDIIECIEQDRGDGQGTQLVQTSNPMCLADLTTVSGRAEATTSDSELIAERKLRVRLVIRNLSASETLYMTIDGDPATTADGFPLYPGETFTEVTSCGAIRGITQTGTVDIAYIEYKLA